MEIITTATAVAAALLGGLLSSLVQQRGARIVRDGERAVTRRSEQTVAVRELAVALAAHRLAMWKLYNAILKEKPDEEIAKRLDEMHATRRTVEGPAVDVQLLVPDAAVRAAADTATQAAYAIRQASDLDDLERLRASAVAAQTAMVDAARLHLTAI